ncbi:hypothetical protein OIU74_023600 [Salix koriyanagi]|uniref:Large ribosomal subunit protein bL9c n=1 Tax=Salix koriyanagi TaxID=2511006 RepID=A0A9Q1ABA6_9ROSI|nr:hypothetical protein OIU74_023600 [Salix koriyanagi]
MRARQNPFKILSLKKSSLHFKTEILGSRLSLQDSSWLLWLVFSTAEMLYGELLLKKPPLRALMVLYIHCYMLAKGVRYRKLEVILTTSIEKLGKAGHTVKVAPGYFRNHLMPKLLAVPNIEKFAHLIREQRKIYQPEEEEEVKVVKETMEDKIKEYETAAKRLAKSRLAFRVGINTAKFRARESKDDPIEILSPVTKDDILKEVDGYCCMSMFWLYIISKPSIKSWLAILFSTLRSMI